MSFVVSIMETRCRITEAHRAPLTAAPRRGGGRRRFCVELADQLMQSGVGVGHAKEEGNRKRKRVNLRMVQGALKLCSRRYG